METKYLDKEDGLLIGELTATFVIAAKMEAEDICPDSNVTKGIKAVVECLSKK